MLANQCIKMKSTEDESIQLQSTVKPAPGGSAPRRNRGVSAALLFLCLCLGAGASRAASTLEFGLPPYISTRTLMALFKPLANFLEQRLKQPVMMVTAPNTTQFDDRLLQNQYDIAIVSPHMVRLTQRDQTYEPLLRFTADLYGILLVRADSPYHSLRDLAGQPIAFPPRSTTTYLLGRELLERHGLASARLIDSQGFQDTLILGLLRGDFPSALVNTFALSRASAADRGLVRQIAQTRRMPHMMFVARASMARADREIVLSAITDFMEKTPEGAQFLAETGLGGVRTPSEFELRHLDTLAAEHRKLWEEQRPSSRPPRW